MATYLYDISNLQLDQNTYTSTSINSIDLRNVSWISNSMYTAFTNCQNLTLVTNINQNVTTIANCFENCSSLINVPTIPTSVTNAQYGFYNCQSLANTSALPNSIVDMAYTFYNCRSLVTANISTNAQSLFCTFANCTSLTDMPTIPNSVTNAGWTFSSCTNLVNTTTIPNSITNLYGTFAGCTNLVNAPTIPDSIISMERSFSYCSNLVDAPEIPNSVVNLASTFSYCTNLINTTEIPNSVINMYSTFSYCNNISNVSVNATEITNATDCFIGTTLAKNVYIPYYQVYTPKINTTTRTSFANAGYDALGTQHGVYLKSTTPSLDITTVPSTASITLESLGHVSHEKSWAVPLDAIVSWTAEAAGYVTRTGSITLDEDKTLNIILTQETVIFYITPTPSAATVTLEATGYQTVTGTGEQHIEVLPGTTVHYTVELEGYDTDEDDELVNQTHYKTIELEYSQDWDFTLDENDQATLIEYRAQSDEVIVLDEVQGTPMEKE